LESEWRFNVDKLGWGGPPSPEVDPWKGQIEFVAVLNPPVNIGGILFTHLFTFPPSGGTRRMCFGRVITPVGAPDGFLFKERAFSLPAGARFPFGFPVLPDN
jgi:hypothetical protein